MIPIILPTIITIFFVGVIACFCIKQNHYEYAMKKSVSSYRPLLDDSFTDRVV